MTGFAPEEFYADPELLIRRLHPDDKEAALTHMQRADAMTARVTLRWQHRDGDWIWTEHQTVPVFDDDGRLVAAEGIARDITERMRADAEIRERERFSRSVLESIQGPTAVLDADGTILRVNHDWTALIATITGADSGASAVGGNYLNLCERGVSAGVAGADQAAAGVRAVLAGAKESFRLDYPTPVGRGERWFAMRVSPLRTEAGGAVVHSVDITDRKRYEQQLARQALHDPLTGLPNRALLADRMDRALARLDGGSCAILVVGLDRFAVVNEGLGHAAGDAVLAAVSRRLKSIVPPGDTVARLGGDEFAIFSEQIEGRGRALALTKRLLEGFTAPVVGAGHDPVPITVSIGIALGDASAGADALLRRADAALHSAKQQGRNRFEFFEPRFHRGALGQLRAEAELQRALDAGELRLLYQPIVELRSGRIRDVEALLRWQHPTRGLVLPDEFIVVAEESGLIVPIGSWVLREAALQARRWQGELGKNAPGVAVNISPLQIQRPSFEREFSTAIASADVDPSTLKLELTETTLMDAQVAEIASSLRDRGVRIVIDDFGTGYSSMSYLKQLPVDEIKIDKSFVDGLGSDSRSAAIVGAIVAMSHTLGLTAIAEGVERTPQRNELLDLGCDLAQGYLLGWPVEPEALQPAAFRAIRRHRPIRVA